jgi:hypothetical protein
MMDLQFCNKKFPFRWRTSMAIYAYEPKPEDLPDEVCDQITYLKIAATITGYQEDWKASDAQALGEVIRQWYPDTPIEELDDLAAITTAYWACYGVQLQVAVFPQPYIPPSEGSEFPSNFNNYPHIVDFQPKMQDLYQSTTEAGEILSASHTSLQTDKTSVSTETAETGISAKAGFDLGGIGGSAELTHKWGETEQDSRSVQSEASSDRREQHGTTTTLSQMYNLLTGYHSGTNRAAFLMLPRPHILQPTDRRTFIQGLRYIEGVQEFFLVVARPKEVEGHCVETVLETGHFPEDVEINLLRPEYEEGSEKFEVYVNPTRETEEFTKQYNIESGWVIDRSQGDDGHPGIRIMNLIPANPSQLIWLEYLPTSDTTVEVRGRTKYASSFKEHFTVFKRKEQPSESSSRAKVTSPFIITSRSLLACMKRGYGKNLSFK